MFPQIKAATSAGATYSVVVATPPAPQNNGAGSVLSAASTTSLERSSGSQFQTSHRIAKSYIQGLNRDALSPSDAMARFQVIMRNLSRMGKSPSIFQEEITSQTAQALEIITAKYTSGFGYFVRDPIFWNSLALISDQTLFDLQGSTHKSILMDLFRNISNAVMSTSEVIHAPTNSLEPKRVAHHLKNFVCSLRADLIPSIKDLFRRDHEKYCRQTMVSENT